MSERTLFVIDGENVSAIGYHPSDDYYLSQDLVNCTLFMQVLLWHYLLYLTIYNILLIVCGSMKRPEMHSMTVTTVNAVRRENEEDGMHYLFTTIFCFCMTTFSVIGIILGQSLFTVAFMLTIPVSCFNSINSLMDSNFQSIKKFFGDEMIDMIANILLVLVEAVASVTTSVYLYQVVMSRYDYVVAMFWPLRISF